MVHNKTVFSWSGAGLTISPVISVPPKSCFVRKVFFGKRKPLDKKIWIEYTRYMLGIAIAQLNIFTEVFSCAIPSTRNPSPRTGVFAFTK